jgi:hypothetical protein
MEGIDREEDKDIKGFTDPPLHPEFANRLFGIVPASRNPRTDRTGYFGSLHSGLQRLAEFLLLVLLTSPNSK